MDADYISEDEFWDEWRVIQKSSGDMFEFEDVKDQLINHVWTVLETGDDDNESWYASPGFHIVNRLGYVMTERPWTDELRDAVYFLHEDIDDGERTVFVYRCCGSLDCTSATVLLFGEGEDFADAVLRENCSDRGCFAAEDVGVSTLCDPTSDLRMHEYCGLRVATAMEAESLPLWGSVKALLRRFRAIGDAS